jgi:hypothetical protein
MPQLRTQLAEVTPAIAEKWLADHNAGNRPISKHVVKTYAEDMREGRWMLTHQGPAFDENDRLIDGQHRLAAVIAADVPVPMYVTFGADSATFVVLDINFKRQPGHLIAGPHSTTKASAARLLTTPPRIYYENRLHNRDAVRIVAEHPRMDDAAALAVRVYKETRINQSMHTALLTLALESPSVAPKVDEWVEGLATGAGLMPGDSRLLLRNKWALEGRHLNAGAGRNDAVFFLVRAWNAFVAGDQMTQFRLPRGGTTLRSALPEMTVSA